MVVEDKTKMKESKERRDAKEEIKGERAKKIDDKREEEKKGKKRVRKVYVGDLGRVNKDKTRKREGKRKDGEADGEG